MRYDDSVKKYNVPVSSITVLWIGALVALVQGSYYIVLAGLEVRKVSLLADIGLAAEALPLLVKANLYQAAISLYFLFCFGYVLFAIHRSTKKLCRAR